MVQNPSQKTPAMQESSSKKNPFLWSFMAVLLLASGTVYFLISRQATLAKNYQVNQQELLEARSKIEDLRQQLGQQGAPQDNSFSLSNKEMVRKISDNFQKTFVFYKLEQRVLEGKNFTYAFMQLEQLMGDALRTPQFDILRNNTQGILPPSSLEVSFKSYSPSHEPKATTMWEKTVSFCKGFLKIKTFQEKEKLETLCLLIRNDRNKKALTFIKENLPEYQEWSQALKTRYEAKQALRVLEKIIFDSLRI